MKSIAAILLSLAAVAGGAEPATLVEEIDALQTRLEAGLTARDTKLLDPLLADPFSWIHSSDGRVDDRATWLASAARGMALSGQRMARSEYGSTIQFHGDPATTALRVARVRLADDNREFWLRQTHTWVRNPGGPWKLAMGQAVTLYDGPPLDPALHARYAGIYELDDGRRLVLEWREGSLLGIFPNGARTQVFLASATDEVVRNPAAGGLRFTLDEDGIPRAVTLVRRDQAVWRATRK